MTFKSLAMGSVAALSLASVMIAAPAFAQDAANPPQYSSPEERAQTQQLNSQGVNGTDQSPAALNGQPMPPGQQSATQAQYQAQQDQYQQQQDQYQNDQDRYHAQREQYVRNLHHYDEARFYFTDYPRAYPYRYDAAGVQKLYLIAEPSQQMANAPVEGPNGEWLGRVRNVEIASDGRPSRIEIALNHRVAVWVQPDDLRFDTENHILFTRLNRADLWDMPGSTFESGPM